MKGIVACETGSEEYTAGRDCPEPGTSRAGPHKAGSWRLRPWHARPRYYGEVAFVQQFKNFVLEGPDSDEDWRDFLAAWYKHLDRFSADVGKHVDDQEMATFLMSLVVPVLRNGFITSERQLDLFNRLQEIGCHLLPVHYYSPIPDTSALPEEFWDFTYEAVPGWSLNIPGQLALLLRLAAYAEELGELYASGDSESFDWNNAAFNVIDASVYYAMIRSFRPSQVIEVGGGHSTCIAALAALRNGDTLLDAIEPYAPPFLATGRPGLRRLIQEPVQSVAADSFTSLEANDILFIDSSHVSKAGSDVNYLILEILPRLKPGVIVHFHDIFLPWNLPRKWTEQHRLFWNEQYLLLAFLQGNRDFEVLLATHYLGRCYPGKLKEAFPYLVLPCGGSFWIRRVRGEEAASAEETP